MEILFFVLLLIGALLHAYWNFILKSAADKAVAVMSIFFTSLPFALFGLVFSGMPKFEFLPIILLSAILHTCYNITLFKTYEIGQLSSSYAIARGTAPLVIFVISFTLFDAKISNNQTAGIILICTGLFTYGLLQLRRNHSHFREFTLASLIGLFIALYSLIDSFGTKITGNALSFLGIMALFNRVFLFLYLYIFEKNFLPRLISGFERRFILGGMISFTCYIIVLAAYMHLPVVIVSTIRETSIVFAVALGVVFLKEKLGWDKVALVTVVLSGLYILAPV